MLLHRATGAHSPQPRIGTAGITPLCTMPTMELAGEDSHRALSYLAALEREGYQPTVDELEAYVRTPPRRRQTILGGQLASVSAAITSILPLNTESIVDYLLRVGWAIPVDGRVRLLDIGRALERALERSANQADVMDVVLDPEDPIVLARLIKQISLRGPGMLVDPYFRLEQLMPVIQHTEINRVLTSERTSESDRAGLATALEQLIPRRTSRFASPAVTTLK